jgi:DNA repair protein RAD5
MVVKKRFFNDIGTILKKKQAENSLFVVDDDDSLTKNDVIATSQSHPIPTKTVFTDKIVNVVGPVASQTIDYLFSKYSNDPEYLKLAIGEYLDGIDEDAMATNLGETDTVVPIEKKRKVDEYEKLMLINCVHDADSPNTDDTLTNTTGEPPVESRVEDVPSSSPDPPVSYPNFTLDFNESLLALSPQTGEPRSSQVDLQDMYKRMHHESQLNKQNIQKKQWKRFIGSLNVQAWATRPTMKPLQYSETLILKRLLPKNTKKQIKKSKEPAVIRLYTVPTSNDDMGREIGRIPEDLTRVFSPLIDLNIARFKVSILESTKRRLSIGDSFFIQIDIFLTDEAFAPINKDDDNDSQGSSLLSSQGIIKSQNPKTPFAFATETSQEAKLRLRQMALSRLFHRLGIRPTRGKHSMPIENNDTLDPENESLNDSTAEISGKLDSQKDETSAITIDSDSNDEENEPESGKPLDDINLDQLKQFYQDNNQSKLLTNLPESTEPPLGNFKLSLRPYQKHGLSWMLVREKEFDVLESLTPSNDFSTQSKRTIRESDEGIINPLWKCYKWPSESTEIQNLSGLESDVSNSKNYFYANMYSGEMSIEKPLIRSTLKGGVLADEMGLGKTISTLALINTVPYDTLENTSRFYASKTTLIVVPMSLLSQWKKEFENANNNSNHFCRIYYGDQTETDLSGTLCNKEVNIPIVLLTTYGTIVNEYSRLYKQRDRFGKFPRIGLYSVDFFRIVLDEGHNIRNRNTKMAKAIYELELQRKWVLTGTPIINRLDDLYSLIKFLKLDPWCNFSYWKTFVTLPFEQKQFSQTLDVIRSILEPIFLRRTKDMKQKDGKPLVELPPKQVVIEEIKFSEREQKFYDWFKAKANMSFKNGIKSGQLLKNYTQILTHILRLRQICCHVDLIASAAASDLEDEKQEDDEAKQELKKLIENDSKDGFESITAANKVMYSLYHKVSIDTSECSICTQSPIPIGEMAVTPCGHTYCLTCILEHIDFQTQLNKPTHCPNCRVSISKYKLFKLRSKEISNKEIRFHTGNSTEDPYKYYPFQLYLYDPDRTSSKIQALIYHLRILKENNPGEKVIVFSQFSSYLDIIENELAIQGGKEFLTYKFDGRLHMQERQKLLEKFNDVNLNKNGITILLLSLKAGGVGLNLTTASKAFMMDPWWSPSIEDQAIDRIHRIGQNETVKVVRFIMENTIENKMLKIQERKKQIGEAVGAEEEERRQRRIEEINLLFEE